LEIPHMIGAFGRPSRLTDGLAREDGSGHLPGSHIFKGYNLKMSHHQLGGSVRQLFTRGTRAVMAAAVLLTLAMADSQAGRFMDDRDFDEALSMKRTEMVRPGKPPPAQRAVTDVPTPTDNPASIPSAPATSGDRVNDPAEELNRLAHRMNQEVRRLVLEPVSDAYVVATSTPVRNGMTNVFSNLREPVWLAGHVLKGDWKAAETTAARFAINTTAGIGGVFDKAVEYGLTPRRSSMDEVFCHYGIGPGPYMVLPVLGPSSVRDAAGRVITIMAQYAVLGAFIVPYRIADVTLQYIAVREDVRSVEQQAVDPYVAERSMFIQLQKLSCGERLEIESRRSFQ
jgi:phospholipid-binding lipoprotein MlaA